MGNKEALQGSESVSVFQSSRQSTWM